MSTHKYSLLLEKCICICASVFAVGMTCHFVFVGCLFLKSLKKPWGRSVAVFGIWIDCVFFCLFCTKTVMQGQRMITIA